MQVDRNKKWIELLALLVCLALMAAWSMMRHASKKQIVEEHERAKVQSNQPRFHLSPLGVAPRWQQLEDYQQTITKEQFLHDLTSYFTVSNEWQRYIKVGDTYADVSMMANNPEAIFRLYFAVAGEQKKSVKSWRRPSELEKVNEAQPLAGLHIAIDAGHLGGEWAQMEERWYKIGDGKPVTEGDMTLYVARILQPLLQAQGAQVTLVRATTEPLTKQRPNTLLEQAKLTVPAPQTAFQLNKAAESLFYRTAEIRARADLVNQIIHPDVVLCLHFNAVAWGDPAQPSLVDENHFHILLNGAYTDEEVGFDDQRFTMIEKILQGTIHEEAALGATMADVFAEETQLPPYPYEDNSTRARNVNQHPYLWARNLLANRLYHCPVIFFEPYVMNSHEVYERVQAGDYQGLPVVAGKPRKSIYREYADAVVDGMVKYYREKRAK